jgi:hypothetical protein
MEEKEKYDPSTKSIAAMEVDLIRFAIESERAGLKWAAAEAIKDQLEDLRKVVLAENMPKEGPVSAREIVALKTEAYRKHIDGLAAARREANEAKVRYVASQAKSDALRTILSNKRESIKRGIEAA